MSLIEDDRRHRHFFSTRLQPPAKPAEMFPTASPKALIHVRSGLYDYPEPYGDENDIILGYRNYSNIKISPKNQSQTRSSLNASRRSAFINSPSTVNNRSRAHVSSSFCDGSPSQLRLAREHAAVRNQSLSGLSNISQMAAQRKQNERSQNSFYSPSGLF